MLLLALSHNRRFALLGNHRLHHSIREVQRSKTLLAEELNAEGIGGLGITVEGDRQCTLLLE